MWSTHSIKVEAPSLAFDCTSQYPTVNIITASQTGGYSNKKLLSSCCKMQLLATASGFICHHYYDGDSL